MFTSCAKPSRQRSSHYPLVLFVLIPFALSIFGCATIVSGSSQDVTITSHPVSALITIENDRRQLVWSGSTPAKVELPRKHSYVLTAEVPGYKSATAFIDKSLNGWLIGNLLCGGIPGGVVDILTGAMWELDPNMLAIEIIAEPEKKEEEESGPEFMVLRLRALDEHGDMRETALTLTPIEEPGKW